jgi:hypothetical protein
MGGKKWEASPKEQINWIFAPTLASVSFSEQNEAAGGDCWCAAGVLLVLLRGCSALLLLCWTSRGLTGSRPRPQTGYILRGLRVHNGIFVLPSPAPDSPTPGKQTLWYVFFVPLPSARLADAGDSSFFKNPPTPDAPTPEEGSKISRAFLPVKRVCFTGAEGGQGKPRGIP